MNASETVQPSRYMTFTLSERTYGIDVTQVQEVRHMLPMTRVPLSPSYVHGLINLRGQVATALGLTELLKLQTSTSTSPMLVVCKCNELLLALIVDQVHHVQEVSQSNFEEPPEALPAHFKSYVTGVYKTPSTLLCVLDINKIADTLQSVAPIN